MPVKTKLKMAMMRAARFRLRSLGLAISRFTWARDSSPLMASTEWPKAIRMPNSPNDFARSVFLRKPRASALKCRLEGIGQRWQWRAVMQHRVNGPDHQDHDHHGGDLHYAQGLVTGFFNALDVFPPVINGHQKREGSSGVVYVELRRRRETWRAWRAGSSRVRRRRQTAH